MDENIVSAHEACSEALNALMRDVFSPGTELTLIMRKPGDDDCYMVISNDDPDKVIEVIQRSKHSAMILNPPANGNKRAGMRKCEVCSGEGPALWDDKSGRYSCVKCHSDPGDDFFHQSERTT